jgi:uncharacterized membrane protein
LTIETNKILGGIGAILSLIGIVSQVLTLTQYSNHTTITTNLALSGIAIVTSLLSFIGFILFLIAMYGFSKDYNEPKTFRYILYAIVFIIVTAIITFVIVFFLFFFSLISLIPTLNPQNITPSQITSTLMTSIARYIPAFGIIGLIYLLFYAIAFNSLAAKSEVPLFKTGASALIAGALVTLAISTIFAIFPSYLSLNTLSIITIPGALVQDAAWIIIAIAFFKITPPPTQTMPIFTIGTTTKPAIYCPNCGTQNQPEARYCTRCGQNLQ